MSEVINRIIELWELMNSHKSNNPFDMGEIPKKKKKKKKRECIYERGFKSIR